MCNVDERPPAIERRMVLHVLQKWREAGGGEQFPELKEIDREALGDNWRDCYVLTVGSSLDDTHFEFIGQNLSIALETDFTSRSISEVPSNTLLYQSASKIENVLQKKVPVSVGGNFENAAGQKVLFRSILLPLSGEDGELGKLLGAANYRILAGH